MNVRPVITPLSIDASDSSIPHTLDELHPGQCARIIAVLPTELADRMCDLGFSVGATVRCEMIGFLGDPMAFHILNGHSDHETCVGQSMIALRKKEARTIQMTQSKDSIPVPMKDTVVADLTTCPQADTESCAAWD